jgi:hypothetical protein
LLTLFLFVNFLIQKLIYGAGVMAEMVEHLISKCKALSSNPTAAKIIIRRRI